MVLRADPDPLRRRAGFRVAATGNLIGLRGYRVGETSSAELLVAQRVQRLDQLCTRRTALVVTRDAPGGATIPSDVDAVNRTSADFVDVEEISRRC